MKVQLISFAFKRGVPDNADLVVDCRVLTNPHRSSALRDLTGQDPRVVQFLNAQPAFRPFLKTVFEQIAGLRCASLEPVRVALGCFGGRHRSVAVAEALAEMLKPVPVEITHRELEPDTSDIPEADEAFFDKATLKLPRGK